MPLFPRFHPVSPSKLPSFSIDVFSTLARFPASQELLVKGITILSLFSSLRHPSLFPPSQNSPTSSTTSPRCSTSSPSPCSKITTISSPSSSTSSPSPTSPTRRYSDSSPPPSSRASTPTSTTSWREKTPSCYPAPISPIFSTTRSDSSIDTSTNPVRSAVASHPELGPVIDISALTQWGQWLRCDVEAMLVWTRVIHRVLDARKCPHFLSGRLHRHSRGHRRTARRELPRPAFPPLGRLARLRLHQRADFVLPSGTLRRVPRYGSSSITEQISFCTDSHSRSCDTSSSPRWTSLFAPSVDSSNLRQLPHRPKSSSAKPLGSPLPRERALACSASIAMRRGIIWDARGAIVALLRHCRKVAAFRAERTSRGN